MIEQGLTSLWKPEGESDRSAIRACSCNLVVIAYDRHGSEWHPCRSLIAYREDEIPGSADPGDYKMTIVTRKS